MRLSFRPLASPSLHPSVRIFDECTQTCDMSAKPTRCQIHNRPPPMIMQLLRVACWRKAVRLKVWHDAVLQSPESSFNALSSRSAYHD